MLGVELLRDRPSGREVPEHGRNVETAGVEDKAVARVRDPSHDEAHVIPARKPLRLRIENPQKPPADGTEAHNPNAHVLPTGHLGGLSDPAHADPTVVGRPGGRGVATGRAARTHPRA
jgi:hypothetical protein